MATWLSCDGFLVLTLTTSSAMSPSLSLSLSFLILLPFRCAPLLPGFSLPVVFDPPVIEIQGKYQLIALQLLLLLFYSHGHPSPAGDHACMCSGAQRMRRWLFTTCVIPSDQMSGKCFITYGIIPTG